MRIIADRFNYLFRSTRGLVMVAIALVSLVVVILGTLSGPMAELGLKDISVRLLGIDLVEAEREGRIIMLYHTIAMAVVAIMVYFITASVPMKKSQQANINGIITVGYITSLVFGLLFAYWGHNFVFHGLFIFGQSLRFFAGITLAFALWPWKKEYRLKDAVYARGPGGIDLERLAFFVMAAAALGSVLYGAIPGSFFGNGFESFLAEDVVREPDKTGLQLAVIGHLHIMLSLIAVALLLIIGRWLDFKGKLHKIAMPPVILGTMVLTAGVWVIIIYEDIAHIIIYVGSTILLPGALCLVIFGFRKIIRERLAERSIKQAGFGQKVSALLHDPLKFGALWQMIYMNFVVTFVGIFMAIRLDEIIRTWPAREERIILTGHWHILAAIIATIILLYFADMIGLKGKTRQWFGWLVIIGSDIAFAAMTLFSTKRLFVSESGQQPVVDWTILVADIGLVVLLATLGVLMGWRLIDLFRSKGRWAEELAEETDGEVSS